MNPLTSEGFGDQVRSLRLHRRVNSGFRYVLGIIIMLAQKGRVSPTLRPLQSKER